MNFDAKHSFGKLQIGRPQKISVNLREVPFWHHHRFTPARTDAAPSLGSRRCRPPGRSQSRPRVEPAHASKAPQRTRVPGTTPGTRNLPKKSQIARCLLHTSLTARPVSNCFKPRAPSSWPSTACACPRASRATPPTRSRPRRRSSAGQAARSW
jgi:hypothetical protein